MTWMAPKLKHRVIIQKTIQTPSDNGGFEQTYEDIKTIWAEMRETSDFMQFAKYTRGVQTEGRETHEFIVRFSSVKDIGKVFTSAFSGEFDSIGDINPIKSEYFIYKKDGGNKGRRFRVMRMKRDDNYKEFLKIRAEELEELGTGWFA